MSDWPTDPALAIHHLEEKWGRDRRCPTCRASNWSVSDEMVLLPHVRTQRRRGRRRHDGHAYHVVRCEQCGLSLLLSSESTGIAPRLTRRDAGDQAGALTGTV